MDVNYSTVILSFREDVRVVAAKWDPQDLHSSGRDKVEHFKTFDKTIEKDDIIVCPSNTRHGFTTFKVTEVDVEIDPDTDEQLRWVAQKVDKKAFDELTSQEDQMIKTLKQSQARAKREMLKKNLMEFADENKLSTIAIAQAPKEEVDPFAD